MNKQKLAGVRTTKTGHKCFDTITVSVSSQPKRVLVLIFLDDIDGGSIRPFFGKYFTSVSQDEFFMCVPHVWQKLPLRVDQPIAGWEWPKTY